MGEISFRQFLEYEQIKPGFTQAVQYNLGIKPEDQIKAPKPIGNAQFGGTTIGNGTIQVVRMMYDRDGNPTKVLVRIMDTAPYGVYKKSPDGTDVITPNKPKFRTQLMSIDDYNKLMTQEIPPDGQMPQGAAGAGMGGMDTGLMDLGGAGGPQ